ncbi:hypothetical protein PV327_000353 [Microctonus hyperodae]|uniref:Odorant receptor n=1 Tax=Microctonus hyperodae TaxID=165561 RepID=A0AA39G727_MICHY|nr:hypothetical protein PV327_000353 [Microctonus hyperodae]
MSLSQYVQDLVSNSTMDTTPDSLLRINRLLLSSVGLWPHQSRLNKLIWFIFTCIFLITQGYLQTGGMIAARYDTPIFMESIAPVLISVMCIIKFINFLYNADKMKALLGIIESDWNDLKDEEELKILYNWAKDSRKNTIWYAAVVYGSMFPFMLGPLIPLMMSLIPDEMLPNNSNTSMSKPLMFHVEYLVDIEKYRLGRLVDSDNIAININLSVINDKPYRRITECIIKHSRTLEYAQILQSANSMSFLFQLGLNMVCISFTGFQAATKSAHIDEAMRYGSFTIAQTFHLFFESWPSQRLTDESSRICEYTTESMWYLTSLRSRKLLQLLIMRSLEPCQLTAGNFYNLNLENFSAIILTKL